MKSRFSWMVITKRMLSYSLLVVMMLVYLVNLSTGELLFSDSEPAEQTELVFNEADPDFSTDYEIDPIDDTLIHSFSNEFLTSSLDMDSKVRMNSVKFSGIHLEIPIPPPRLKS